MTHLLTKTSFQIVRQTNVRRLRFTWILAGRFLPAWPLGRGLRLRAPRTVAPGSTYLLPGSDSGHAKPQAVEPVARREPVAERRPAVQRVEVPTSAPVHLESGAIEWTHRVVSRRPGIEVTLIPIGTPLPDIPMHVKEPERVWPLLAHRMSLIARIAVEPCMVTQAPPIIPEAVPCRVLRPAGVFPFRLRRQAVPAPFPSGTETFVPSTG